MFLSSIQEKILLTLRFLSVQGSQQKTSVPSSSQGQMFYAATLLDMTSLSQPNLFYRSALIKILLHLTELSYMLTGLLNQLTDIDPHNGTKNLALVTPGHLLSLARPT